MPTACEGTGETPDNGLFITPTSFLILDGLIKTVQNLHWKPAKAKLKWEGGIGSSYDPNLASYEYDIPDPLTKLD